MTVLDVDVKRKVYRTARGERVALAELAFSVPQGEFTCILGPSGCGKTTLLALIAGLDLDYIGRITRAVGNGGLGMVFQTPRLMPWLSVRQNVGLALPSSAAADGRVEAILREMHLDDVLEAFPGRLSGGQQRRVALARAFVNEPDLLLLDEPFQSLDAPTADQLRDLLVRMWLRTRPTILFVTHDLREALSLADRILFLSASPGRVTLDLPLALSRPRHPDSPAVETMRKQLLETHPDLLRGLGAGLAENVA